MSREIPGGAVQSFRVALKQSQYVRIVTRMTGIIVRVALFDPAGNQIVLTSNPSGGHGRIYVSEIAATSGDYKLEIRSTEVWANPGRVEVGIDELRTANAEDALRIDAERSFAKAIKDDESRSFKTAIEGFRKSLTAWNAIRDPHWEALTQYALAQTYRRSGDAKKAEEHLAESLKVEVDSIDWRIRAAALNDLGINQANAGKNETAISLLTQSLELFEAHSDRRGQASSLNNLAQTYGRMGDLRKSLELAERTLPLRLAENFQSGANNARNTLGGIYDKLGEPHKSLEYFTQALEGFQLLAKANQLESPDRLSNSFNSVAIANEKLGNWDKAIRNYDEALKVSNISVAQKAAVLINKGDLYASLGDPDTAMHHLTEARTLIDSLPKSDPDTKASVFLLIGQLHAASGRFDEALSNFQQARAINPNAPKLAYILTALGDAWSSKGNLEEALKAYEEALKLKVEDRRSLAVTHQKLGEAYSRSRNHSSALKEFELALSLWRAIIDPRGEAATLNSLALLERERNNISAALKHSDEATRILESLRTTVSSHKLRTSYFARHENYYELNIDLKMRLYVTEKSEQLRASAFAASERARARNLIDTLSEARSNISEGVSDELIKLEHQTHQKLRAKLEAQTALLSTNHRDAEAKLLAQEVSELLRQHDEIKGRIRAASPKYAQLLEPQLASVSEIQRQLDTNTLLVEYALGEKRSYVWVVSSDSIKGFELPARNEIEDAANRLVKALTARSRSNENENPQQRQLRIVKEEAEYPEASTALSKMVIGPIASLLDRKRLVVVADGALQLVPFSSLMVKNPEGIALGRPSASGAEAKSTNALALPLISRYEIVTLPSASVLALQRRVIGNRKPAPLAVAILADPVFDADDERVAKARASSAGNGGVARKAPAPSSGVHKSQVQNVNGSESLTAALRSIGLKNISWLPFSRAEADAIKKFAPKDTFTALDFDASRATATSPSLAKYRILHIATHGVMDLEHPELSGIILSLVDDTGKPVDGYLRLQEIYNLNLPAELVVLSACQTGVGKQIKGEGLIALTRGFMYAGAKSVVASYWKVDDRATAELMAEFYKQMFVNKQKPSAALRLAQIKISEQKRWNSPHYWAGFFLQGEWN